MRRVLTLLVLLLPFIAGACAGTHADSHASTLGGDVEVRGNGVAHWPQGEFAQAANFEWIYETTGFRSGEAEPFHKMKSVLEISYDPATGTVRSARLRCSEDGHAYRHICLTPAGKVLRIRMATLLDDRSEDLTVMKVHGNDPSTHSCEDIGIGPKEGVVEGLEVVFADDGSFTVLQSSNASLFGAELRIERSMTKHANATAIAMAEFP